MGVAFASSIDNLLADMLPFAVTIGPYDQQLSLPGLVFNVLGDRLFILRLGQLSNAMN